MTTEASRPVRRIHHLDIVVRDLDRAAERYRAILGYEPVEREHLPQRGIDLVRFRVGESWIILVQPLTDDSPVKEFLDRHGEGFFHIAYEVDGVVEAGEALRERGVRTVQEVPRRGVEGWQLIDLEIDDTFGAMTQLVEPATEAEE